MPALLMRVTRVPCSAVLGSMLQGSVELEAAVAMSHPLIRRLSAGTRSG